jgi:hypothetical protein
MQQKRETHESHQQTSVKASSRCNRENAARRVRVILIKDGVLLRGGSLASGRVR